MESIDKWYVRISFYLLAFLLSSFFYGISKRGDIEELVVLGGTILGSIAAIGGLCYAGATAVKKDTWRAVFEASGSRFLHCFLSALLGIFLVGAQIHIRTHGVFGSKGVGLVNIVYYLILPFTVLSLLKAGRSFHMGFGMLHHLLEERFPYRDEELFDDIKDDSKYKPLD